MPTILELARVPQADNRLGARQLRPITGRCWVRYLSGKAASVYGELSLEQPERLRSLAKAWQAYSREFGVVLPADMQYRP